jgi:hypothetical protein
VSGLLAMSERPLALEPRYDVTFEFTNPPTVTVTVGVYANGQWDACTF